MVCVIFGNHHVLLMPDVNIAVRNMCGNPRELFGPLIAHSFVNVKEGITLLRLCCRVFIAMDLAKCCLMDGLRYPPYDKLGRWLSK